MKKVLYLGLSKPDPFFSKYFFDPAKKHIIHYPIIKIVPQEKNELIEAIEKSSQATHLIFTSQTAVSLFFSHLQETSFTLRTIHQKTIIAVGKQTTQLLKRRGIGKILCAEEETAEGIITLLKKLPLHNSSIFWPRSKISRSCLSDYFLEARLKFEAPIFYDTVFDLKKPLPNFDEIDEIVFTSPSTVDAFYFFFPNFRHDKILTPIGEITKKRLDFLHNLL